jgi:hypothetical protein
VAPATAGQPSEREASVTLATRNIALSATFYAKLTGRDIQVRGGTAEITPGLLLYQFASDTLIDASFVHIAVDDLPATIRRLGLNTTPPDGTPATIEVHDPDGRIVRISEIPARSLPDR